MIETDIDTSREAKISSVLIKLGVAPSLSGYRYSRTAIAMVLEDESLLSAITKEVYPEVAKKYKTTSTRAERAIRHAIATMAKKSNNELITKLFGSLLADGRSKPTNSEFIATVAEYIRLNEEV